METPEEIPFNELYRTGEHREAVEEIRNALVFSELDAEDALYDEAVSMARDGHLGKARDRLRMMLTLNSADGGGHLLLAKVFAAQRKWHEAIAELDAAASCGQKLPPGLRDAFIESRDAEAGPRAPRVVRTDGEVKALRDEARRLRSTHSRMERESRDLVHQAQVWRIATGVVTAVAGLALVMIGFSWPGEEDYGVEQLASVEEIQEDNTVEVLEELEDVPDVGEPTLDELPSEDEVFAANNPSPDEGYADLTKPPSERKKFSSKSTSSKPSKPSSKPSKQDDIEGSGASVDAYTVQSGDTLWKIAGRVYGDKTRWKDIRDANQGVLKGKNGEGVRVGMVLEIPQERS